MKYLRLLSIASLAPFVGLALGYTWCFPGTPLGNSTQYQAAGNVLCSGYLLNYTDPATGIFVLRNYVNTETDCQAGITSIIDTCIDSDDTGGILYTAGEGCCVQLGSPSSTPDSQCGPATTTPYTTRTTTTTTTTRPPATSHTGSTITTPSPTPSHKTTSIKTKTTTKAIETTSTVTRPTPMSTAKTTTH